MRLLSIQVGKPQTFAATSENETEWTSGIDKRTVSGPIAVHRENLEGDAQANLRVHGGPDKAICVYPSEHYSHWSTLLDLPLPPGSFGENFTTAGLLESDLCIGDTFTIGSAILQITQPRQPCWKLARRWNFESLPIRVQETGYTGFYFRVLQTGTVQAGQTFELTSRPNPSFSLDLANRLMHGKPADPHLYQQHAACPELSSSWKKTFSKKAEKHTPDSSERLNGPQ